MISCGGCIELYYAKHVGLLFEELFTCTIIDNNFGLEKSFEKSNRCGTCKPPVVNGSSGCYGGSIVLLQDSRAAPGAAVTVAWVRGGAAAVAW